MKQFVQHYWPYVASVLAGIVALTKFYLDYLKIRELRYKVEILQKQRSPDTSSIVRPTREEVEAYGSNNLSESFRSTGAYFVVFLCLIGTGLYKGVTVQFAAKVTPIEINGIPINISIDQDALKDSTLASKLGYAYQSTGDFKKALFYNETALQLEREANDSALIQDRLSALALTYRSLGKFKQAEKYLEEAIGLAKEDRSIYRERNHKYELAEVYRLQGKEAEAIDLETKLHDTRPHAIGGAKISKRIPQDYKLKEKANIGAGNKDGKSGSIMIEE